MFLMCMSPAASARFFNELKESTSEATYLLNNKKEQTMSITSFNVDLTGCNGPLSGMMKIEKITMDSDDRYPEKMLFRDMRNNKLSMPTNFSGLDNVSRSWVDSMFSEGDWVYLQHAACGSGGFEMMLSITKHTTKYPTAGITITP